MRVKHLICFAVLCICVSFASCRKQEASAHPAPAKEQTSGEKHGVFATEIELQLLAARYADEERILRGDLKSYEIDALGDLREGMLYIREKYPGYEFMPVAVGPYTVWYPWMEISVQCDDGSIFTVWVRRDTDGNIRCSDDFEPKEQRNPLGSLQSQHNYYIINHNYNLP